MYVPFHSFHIMLVILCLCLMPPQLSSACNHYKYDSIMKLPLIIHSQITNIYITSSFKYQKRTSTFTELVSYLDTLNVHFKIIALSQTAINSHNVIYTMPNYSI